MKRLIDGYIKQKQIVTYLHGATFMGGSNLPDSCKVRKLGGKPLNVGVNLFPSSVILKIRVIAYSVQLEKTKEMRRYIWIDMIVEGMKKTSWTE